VSSGHVVPHVTRTDDLTVRLPDHWYVLRAAGPAEPSCPGSRARGIFTSAVWPSAAGLAVASARVTWNTRRSMGRRAGHTPAHLDPDPADAPLADVLRIVMRLRDMSVDELATGLNVANERVRRLVACRPRPTPWQLERIAETLGVPPDILLLDRDGVLDWFIDHPEAMGVT